MWDTSWHQQINLIIGSFTKKKKKKLRKVMFACISSRARMIANSCYLIIEEKYHVYISIEDQLQKHLLKQTIGSWKKKNIWR